MDKLIEQINQVLQDPGSMQQIMEMAQVLGSTSAQPNEHTVPEELTGGIVQAISKVQEKESKQQALVQALLPYLRPRHQKRLERAFQIAHLSQIAGAALKTNLIPSVEEGPDDL